MALLRDSHLKLQENSQISWIKILEVETLGDTGEDRMVMETGVHKDMETEDLKGMVVANHMEEEIITIEEIEGMREETKDLDQHIKGLEKSLYF